MIRKAGICERCKQSKPIYNIEKTNYSIKDQPKTIHWWCNKCCDIETSFNPEIIADSFKTYIKENEDGQVNQQSQERRKQSSNSP